MIEQLFRVTEKFRSLVPVVWNCSIAVMTLSFRIAERVDDPWSIRLYCRNAEADLCVKLDLAVHSSAAIK